MLGARPRMLGATASDVLRAQQAVDGARTLYAAAQGVLAYARAHASGVPAQCTSDVVSQVPTLQAASYWACRAASIVGASCRALPPPISGDAPGTVTESGVGVCLDVPWMQEIGGQVSDAAAAVARARTALLSGEGSGVLTLPTPPIRLFGPHPVRPVLAPQLMGARPAMIGDFWDDTWSFVQKLGGDVLAIANVLGFVGVNVQLTLFLNALAGTSPSPATLWSALSEDYTNLIRDQKLASSIETDGDFTKAWNIATDNGKNVGSLNALLQNPPPQPQPSNVTATGRLTIVNGKVAPETVPFDDQAVLAASLSDQMDPRDGAQQLYDHGFYLEGDQAYGHWRAELWGSPVGATVLSGTVQATGKPTLMYAVVDELRSAAADPQVQASWSSHNWGDAQSFLNGLADDLKKKADAQADQIVKSASPPPKSAATSVGTVLLVGTGATIAAGLGTAVAVAYLRHTTTRRVLEGAWQSTKSGVGRAVARTKRLAHR